MQVSQAFARRSDWARTSKPTFSLGGWRILFRAVIVLLPTILAGIYYGVLATPRYVSEARFVIRAASKPPTFAGSLGSLMELVGLSHSQDDAFSVRDFLTSRDAVKQLESRIDMKGIYQHPDVDFLVRYPSPVFRATDEGFYRYLENRISVVVNSSTGLTTLKVEAFRPGDAQKVASTLLDLGEALVNKLNDRLEQDAVRVAVGEVAHAEQARIESQIALTGFRNRSLILDPGASSAMVVELIGQLAGQLADVRTQIAETQANSPDSPQLATLRQRAMAIEHQIATERGRVANDSDGLANKIAEYERLMLNDTFAVRILGQAVGGLEMARADARRQQMFLERVVEPGVQDQPILPERVRSVFTVFGFNVMGACILWLLVAGLTEHAGMASRR